MMAADSTTRSATPLRIVVLGLSLTSSWGNGHATTYRALLRALHKRGHEILFLERDVPWYASHRDLPAPTFACVELYQNLDELRHRFAHAVRAADLVIVGSYVPEGVAVGDAILQMAEGPVAFYDIDTPVTLAKLARQDYEYIAPRQIAGYDLYLSFAGGPTLEVLETRYQSPAARAFYCSVDPELYYPEEQDTPPQWDLGYMGTYSPDRQPGLAKLLLTPAHHSPARQFVVAGPNFPPDIQWSENVARIEHLPPHQHRAFYCGQRFTLNITRSDMVAMGYSPSVRLFEAAACGTPIISDYWAGLDTIFALDTEILVAHTAQDVLGYLCDLDPAQAEAIGTQARHKVLQQHTAHHRALELEQHYYSLVQKPAPLPEAIRLPQGSAVNE